MKKTILFALTVLAGLLSSNVQAQKKFTEGNIIYSIVVESDETGMMAAMMPTEMSMQIKGTKSRSEMKSSVMETIAISDNKDNSGLMLMNIMGQKFALQIDEAFLESQKDKIPDYQIIESTKTKSILGSSCKLVHMVDQKTNDTVEVYYTPAIPYYSNTINTAFKSIKGMPMEFSTSMQGIRMKVLVKSITAAKIDDANFIPDAAYKIVTKEELMKSLSGQ